MATTPTPIPFDNNPGVVFKKADVPATDEPKKKWTAEEVEEMAKVTMKSFGWEGELPKKEKKADKPVEENVEEPPKALSTPENDPQKPKPAKKPAPKNDEPDMADRIVAGIGAENEKLLAKIRPAPTEVQETNGELDPEDKHQLEVFAAMAKMPGVEPDLPKKFEQFFKLQEAYQSKWEQEHPDKVYNPDADEHADWYEDNQPAYDERKFNRAQTELAARKIVAEKEAEGNARHAIQTATAIAESSIEASTEALEEGVKSQLLAIVGENTILDSPGPISKEFQKSVGALSEKISTASVLMTPGTGIRFNPQNPVHKAIQDDVNGFDFDIAALSGDEQRKMVVTALGKKSRVLGKKFVSMDEYSKLPEDAHHTHWSVATEPALVAKLMTVKAKKEIEEWIDSISNQLGKKKTESTASQASHSLTAAGTENSRPAAAKPSPPSIGTGASHVTSQIAAPSKDGNSWEALATNF